MISVLTTACTGTGIIQQANESAVVVLDRAGRIDDRGVNLASEYCAKHGTITVLSVLPGWVRTLHQLSL